MTTWGFAGYELNLKSPFIKEHPVKSVIAFVLYFAPTLYQLGSVIRAHGIQVVNMHYPMGTFLYFVVLRWLLPIRLAVSIHGADLLPDGRRMDRYIDLVKSYIPISIAPMLRRLRGVVE